MAILVLIPLFIFALIFPSEVRSQGALQRVVITYSSRSIAAIDLFVAQERGFFREEGLDAQILGLPAPAPASKVFDFSLQREVNPELGVK